MPSRSSARDPVRLIAAVYWLACMACIACMGCDQFATIGIRDPERQTAGAPAPPESDAGKPTDRDAALPIDAGSSPDSGTTHDAGPGCTRADVAVCNPVTNEGCAASLMMQCAVDFSVPLTGYCIFFSGGPPPSLGGACLNTGVTESCPPTSTCVAEQCRKLCLCDADCEAGQCCTEPLESTGFKICGDC